MALRWGVHHFKSDLRFKAVSDLGEAKRMSEHFTAALALRKYTTRGLSLPFSI